MKNVNAKIKTQNLNIKPIIEEKTTFPNLSPPWLAVAIGVGGLTHPDIRRTSRSVDLANRCAGEVGRYWNFSAIKQY